MKPAARLALLATLALPFAVASAPTATAASFPFSFGTYKGKLSTGGAMAIRLRQGTCDKARQYVIPTKGACLRISALDIKGGACPDGTTVEPTLGAYLTDKEEIHLARTGKYSDIAETSFGQGQTITGTTIKFKAKGRKIAGTIKIVGSEQADLKVACTTVSATFMLKLPS